MNVRPDVPEVVRVMFGLAGAGVTGLAVGAARRRTVAVGASRRIGVGEAGPNRMSAPRPAPGLLRWSTVPPAALVDALHDMRTPSALVDTVPALWPALVVVGLAAPVVALVTSGPLLAGLVAGGLLVVARSARRFLRSRASARLEVDLPLALDEVVGSLRSGASLTQALAEASRLPGPLGRDLREVVFAATHGGGLVRALEAWAVRRPLPGVRLTVAALALGLDAGGAQARAVDGVATTLRERQQLAAEVRALSSQARMSAVVLSVAPVGFAVVLASVDHDVADFFLHRPAGTLCLAVGIGLDAAAAGWMGRIARVAQ